MRSKTKIYKIRIKFNRPKKERQIKILISTDISSFIYSIAFYIWIKNLKRRVARVHNANAFILCLFEKKIKNLELMLIIISEMETQHFYCIRIEYKSQFIQNKYKRMETHDFCIYLGLIDLSGSQTEILIKIKTTNSGSGVLTNLVQRPVLAKGKWISKQEARQIGSHLNNSYMRKSQHKTFNAN